MAAGIGMEVGQREADLAAQTAAQMAEAMINLLKALGRPGGEHYSDDFDRGMKVISRHVRSHGILQQSIFDERDADLFANALRETHIPYMRFSVRMEGGVQKTVFLTRGGSETGDWSIADDGAKLEKAWSLFVKRMMERSQAPGMGQYQQQPYPRDRGIREEREI